MLDFFDVSFEDLKTTRAAELYSLRKRTFSDRLGWDVVCSQGMESDEFDGPGMRYILGVCKGQLICSVRFVALCQPNMITHTFHDCFSAVALPAEGTESSRFFVDKPRARELLGKDYPVSQLLFLAMINWARKKGYPCIHTIVSRAMCRILLRSGWQISVLKEAYLTGTERIYLLSLPAGEQDQNRFAEPLSNRMGIQASELATWPLRLPA